MISCAYVGLETIEAMSVSSTHQAAPVLSLRIKSSRLLLLRNLVADTAQSRVKLLTFALAMMHALPI